MSGDLVADITQTEAKPTEESIAAMKKALKEIAFRPNSYATRNNLPKMIKCQVCRLRHRGPQCNQGNIR